MTSETSGSPTHPVPRSGEPSFDAPAGESGFAPSAPVQGHPVIAGLAATVAVTFVVGIFLGLGALTASKVLGLGGGAGDGASVGATMYLPEPKSTAAASGPLITLGPGESEAPSVKPSSPSESSAADTGIQLVVSPDSVGSFERINLSGTYPAGEGSVLQVQRFEGGRWNDFSVTVSVNGGKFATYVQTSHSGRNKFRVLDRDSGNKSNPVFVTVR